MDIEAPEANETIDDETMEKLNKPSDNPLLVTMEEKDAPSLKERKASMWFGKDIFQGKQVLNNQVEFRPILTSFDHFGQAWRNGNKIYKFPRGTKAQCL